MVQHLMGYWIQHSFKYETFSELCVVVSDVL